MQSMNNIIYADPLKIWCETNKARVNAIDTDIPTLRYCNFNVERMLLFELEIITLYNTSHNYFGMICDMLIYCGMI